MNLVTTLKSLKRNSQTTSKIQNTERKPQNTLNITNIKKELVFKPSL